MVRPTVSVNRKSWAASKSINTTIKITSVCDGDARSVGGGRGWLAGNTDGLAGWPVTGDGRRGQPASSRR